MTPAASRTLTLGTRGSALARWQTGWVLARLAAANPGLSTRVKLFTTSGDRILDKPLPEIGGKGLFTEELESALRTGEIDLAVHSLKDLPVQPADGLAIGAICAREDARDVLIARAGLSFDFLPAGARLGTSSLRRSAQLLARRPDLTLLPLRGNVDTRLRKALAGDYDAIVLAAAGVLRLGLAQHVSEYLPFEVMLPAPGQGALAVQCRRDDAGSLDILAALDDTDSRTAVTAERAFLEALGGGCSAPIAAYAHYPVPGASLHMSALVATADGRQTVRVAGSGADPLALGRGLADTALAQAAGDLIGLSR
jgi:hydroxymethylbilane synthase